MVPNGPGMLSEGDGRPERSGRRFTDGVLEGFSVSTRRTSGEISTDNRRGEDDPFRA